MAAQVDAKLDNNATPSSSPSPSILFYKVANGSIAGARHAITILRVIPPFIVIIYTYSNTEVEKMACTWFGEICSCCCLPALTGPAWVLLKCFANHFFGPCTSSNLRSVQCDGYIRRSYVFTPLISPFIQGDHSCALPA